ncbi:hypothetical protein [Nocardia sp. NBC_01327]|uniref:hypothetical protein n=1 Tax=Nocardia sp. NBC_01327 TaxID=2903593 RepID=UPI002E0F5DC8|nr:hypothetical protein OG326_42135 [Nocardia sp. NBC_01327]
MTGAMSVALRAVRDRLLGAIRASGSATADLTRGAADALEGAPRWLSGADIEAADQVTWFSGTTDEDEQIEQIRFRLEDVWSKPLTDAGGVQIGATFEREHSYPAAIRWIEQPTREADTKVTPIEVIYGFRTALGKPEDAPWADAVRKSGQPPNYLIAHADRDGFWASINRGTEAVPDWVDVKVNGREFGQMLAADENSARAIGRNPAGEHVLIACSSGAPEASAARLAAEHLHTTGVVTGPIHAPTDTAATPISGSGDSVRTHLGVLARPRRKFLGVIPLPRDKLFESYPPPENP